MGQLICEKLNVLKDDGERRVLDEIFDKFLNKEGTGILIGASGATVNLETSGQKALAVYTKSTRTSGDQMAGYFEYHLAGAACEGQAIRARLEIDAAAGGSQEAIYAITDMNAQTVVGGKITALRGMMTLPTAELTHGTVSAIEAEMYSNTGIAGLNNVPTMFMKFTLNGTDKTPFNTYATLFDLDGVSDTANGLFDTINVGGFDACLKIRVNNVPYFIPLSADNGFV